jgi:hypothetical protein
MKNASNHRLRLVNHARLPAALRRKQAQLGTRFCMPEVRRRKFPSESLTIADF